MASTKVSAVQLQRHNNPYNTYIRKYYIVLVVSINAMFLIKKILYILTKSHTVDWDFITRLLIL